MTPEQTTQVLSVLKSAYPREVIAKETVAVYVSELADLDYAITAKAIRKLVRTSEWFPTIARIRAEVDAITPRGNPPNALREKPGDYGGLLKTIREKVSGLFVRPEPPKEPKTSRNDALREALTSAPTASPDEERAMIERTIERARAAGDR